MAVTKLTRKNKNGIKTTFYLADIYIRGVKVSTKTFETRAEAEVWHDQTKSDWESGRDKTKIVERDLTFGHCIQAYLNHKEGFLKLRKSSQQSMEARMDQFLKSPVVTTQMADFTDHTIDAWFDWILTQPTAKNPGRKSFKIELKYLSIILNWYRNERNASFTVPIVRRHRRRAKFKYVAPRRKDYFIREEDIHPWIEWLKTHRSDPLYHRLATFMVVTGTRIGEACGIKWDMVNLDRGEVYISRSLSWDQRTRKPYPTDMVKSEDSNRLIHIPEAIVRMLKVMKLETGGQGAVFRNKKGDLVRDNAVRSAFNAGFEALGLPWRATHICRHTWGTLGLKANGDNISKVQVNMGHSDRRVSEIYAKAQAQADRSTVENTARLMGFK